MRYKVDTESIIRKALGLLENMAKSPESERILLWLVWFEPEKLAMFEKLVGEIEKAKTDSELAEFSQELVLFVEEEVLLTRVFSRPVISRGFSNSAIETAIDPANEKYVKDNRAWLQNTVSQIRGLLDQMRGKK